MLKKLFLVVLLALVGTGSVFAFTLSDSSVAVKTDVSQLPGIRISLITCGPGYEEVYEVFGHTAIRIIDSAAHTDMVYNYGTFNGFEKNFELKFMQGKLLYYLSVYPFRDFLPEYQERQRSVTEQVLNMDKDQKKAFANYLDKNAEPENREYKYDFFYDNCATRIRDLYPETMGKTFAFGPILPKNSKLTFRDIINQYFYATKWERFGINILLGSRIDKVMTDKDIMFLPDYLKTGIEGATVNGNKLAAKPEVLLPAGPAKPDGVSGPMVLTMCIAMLTIAGLSIKKLSWLGKIMSTGLLFVTGLLGCLILVMWFATNHQGCANNYNLLWALPTNIILAFWNPKGKPRYALVAIVLIFTTIILHILRIQQLIMIEFMPLLLALLYIYGTIYRKSQLK